MANNLTSIPWIIDTVAASTDIVTGNVEVRSIIIDGSAIAAADAFEFTDTAGKVKFSIVASAATLGPMQFLFPEDMFRCTGLRCSQLGHGKMYLYVSPESKIT